jgi:hypothetical protein
MPSLHGTPDHWIGRAKEAREMASSIKDADARRAMMIIAENYEKIAKRAEAREVGIDVTHRPAQR